MKKINLIQSSLFSLTSSYHSSPFFLGLYRYGVLHKKQYLFFPSLTHLSCHQIAYVVFSIIIVEVLGLGTSLLSGKTSFNLLHTLTSFLQLSKTITFNFVGRVCMLSIRYRTRSSNARRINLAA